MAQLLSDLQGFSIGNTVSFEEGPNGLLRAAIITPHAEATVYLHGAHVTHYRPVGQKPLLFMSEKSHFDAMKPIRGGIPICFPWFGPRVGDSSAPLHGFARVMPWTVESAAELADKSIVLDLRLVAGEATLRVWPFPFSLRYRITVGPALELSLEVHNTGERPITFEEALHTYFAVGDVRQLSITGLAGGDYLDKTDGMKRKTQGESPVMIEGETDRVYLDARQPCVIEDPVLARRLTIEKSGSDTTVLWNPWIAKAKAMADFGDEEWVRMVCIESANAQQNAVNLAPNLRHVLNVRYVSEPR